VAQEIRISNALVRLIDQLDVPAREAGTLVQLDVQEGAKVAEGAKLARIDDSEARYAEERAKLELQIATQNAASDVGVRSAQRAAQAANLELTRADDARQRLRDVVTEKDRKAVAGGGPGGWRSRSPAASRAAPLTKKVETDFAQASSPPANRAASGRCGAGL
jgi:multidrug efflux pump subunit AcrA (membrane-fusion protein)